MSQIREALSQTRLEEERLRDTALAHLHQLQLTPDLNIALDIMSNIYTTTSIGIRSELKQQYGINIEEYERAHDTNLHKYILAGLLIRETINKSPRLPLPTVDTNELWHGIAGAARRLIEDAALTNPGRVPERVSKVEELLTSAIEYDKQDFARAKADPTFLEVSDNFGARSQKRTTDFYKLVRSNADEAIREAAEREAAEREAIKREEKAALARLTSKPSLTTRIKNRLTKSRNTVAVKVGGKRKQGKQTRKRRKSLTITHMKIGKRLPQKKTLRKK